MAEITATGTALTGTNTALSGAASQGDTDSSTNTTEESVAAVANDTPKSETVAISTRAQKIQKLNEEFFSAGPRAFKITAEFIDRLEEYGFLSAGEAEKLGGGLSSASTSNEGAKTIDELSAFIDSFAGSIEEIEPGNSLIDILRQAQAVLDDFNEPTAASQGVNIASITEQLKSYNSTSTSTLPQADQKSFDQLISALEIASVLKPGVNTTAEIDKYLAISQL